MIKISDNWISRSCSPGSGYNYPMTVEGEYSAESMLQELMTISKDSWGMVSYRDAEGLLIDCVPYNHGNLEANLIKETVDLKVDNFHCYATKKLFGTEDRVDYNLQLIT